ncbi:MAG TPA: DegV family protein [Anaerolineales bacterium]|nr:DegV family protein [Anaerolineales bacterium]
MTRIAIVTDSTAYIPENLRAQYNIYVAPQQLIWGTETFRDGVDITPTQFYQRLRVDKVNPKTSQASPGALKEVFTHALKSADAVLAILISSGVSQTFNSANVAKADMPGAQIEVVDSRMIAMAMGFICIAAAKAAAEGKSLAEVKKLAEDSIAKVGVVFVVDTLDYLHRGGRIGGAQRLIGNALNVKPVLELRDGRVEPLERVRTKKKAVDYMIGYIADRVAGKSRLQLATLHADAEAEARELLDTASKRLNPVETVLTEVSPVVGTHTGPGTVGLAWMTD